MKWIGGLFVIARAAFRDWRYRRYLARVHRVLDRLDVAIRAAGLSRQERRRIWREVIAGRVAPADLIGGKG